jgi:hypothetical protein
MQPAALHIECSMLTLKMFLEEQDQIPWAALVYVTVGLCTLESS